METFYSTVLFSLALILVSGSTYALAQKAKPKSVIKPKSIFFAVLNDGKTIEPVGMVQDGKFIESPGVDLDGGKDGWTPLFAAKRRYTLIFGGTSDGLVTVVKRGTGECSGISGEVNSTPVKGKLKGFVMALATNAPVRTKSSGIRRLPTASERADAEKLVRAEFTKNNISDAAGKQLRYHNLTAIDIEKDGTAELVGTFWIAPKTDERSLLFFIAAKNAEGDYAFEYSEFESVKPDGVMSGDLKDLDDGIGNELLLDYFDIDGDGKSEIFTTSQAFEGRNFAVYKRENSKWTRVHESYNYRCGY
ncbi:MAG: hypothetical protein ACT4O9_15465 [Blastocatellia bacterium]